MNTIQLLQCIKSDPLLNEYCCGVVPSDHLTLKKTLAYPCYFISNTRPHNDNGEHWVLFFLPSEAHCIYFDSYGRAPLVVFRKYLKGTATTTSQKQVQGLSSDACGAHCLYVAYNLVRGISFDTTISTYSKNFEQKDNDVMDFVNTTLDFENMTKPVVVECHCNQTCKPTQYK